MITLTSDTTDKCKVKGKVKKKIKLKNTFTYRMSNRQTKIPLRQIEIRKY